MWAQGACWWRRRGRKTEGVCERGGLEAKQKGILALMSHYQQNHQSQTSPAVVD